MATHSSILAWRIPVDRGACRLQSMGLQRVGDDWVTQHSTWGTRRLKMPLRLWEVFGSLKGTVPPWKTRICFPIPRKSSRRSSGQCFCFSSLPNSSESCISWCASREITLGGVYFSKQVHGSDFVVRCFPFALSRRAPSLVHAVCQLFPVENTW